MMQTMRVVCLLPLLAACVAGPSRVTTSELIADLDRYDGRDLYVTVTAETPLHLQIADTLYLCDHRDDPRCAADRDWYVVGEVPLVPTEDFPHPVHRDYFGNPHPLGCTSWHTDFTCAPVLHERIVAFRARLDMDAFQLVTSDVEYVDGPRTAEGPRSITRREAGTP